MPWTGSRPRDEWLAEVRRRGERIRRRRRAGLGVVLAVAVVLPVSVVASVVRDRREGSVEVSIAGPAPSNDLTEPAPAVTPEARTDGLNGSTPPEASSPPVGAGSTTTTTELRRRGPASGDVVEPTPPGTVPPADDPVVAQPGTGAGASNVASSSSNGAGNIAGTTSTLPPGVAPLSPCAAAEVTVTVSTERSTYRRGEVVEGSSSLRNRSTSDCLLPTRAFFHIEDAEGVRVGSFSYTADVRPPARAEPGQTFTSSFTWDQRICTSAQCTHAAAGRYVAVAAWESGPYAGRTTIEVSG